MQIEFYPVLVQTVAQGTKFLLRIMPVFAAGVYAANLLERTGWMSRLAGLAGPIMRLGRLSRGCGAGFMTSIISPTAGHALLADLRRSGGLSRREMIVAAVVNNLPGEVAAGKSVLPLAVPALGVFGAAYYALLLVAAFLKASLMLMLGRIFMPHTGRVSATYEGISRGSGTGFTQAARESLRPALKSVLKASKTMIPAAYAIYALIILGLFDKASGPMSFLTAYLPLNPAALPVLAARMVSPVGAYTVAGGLFSANTVAGPDLVFALFAGAFAATATSLRYLVPYYCGIFGAGDGGVIIIVSLIARTVSYGAVLAALTLAFAR